MIGEQKLFVIFPTTQMANQLGKSRITRELKFKNKIVVEIIFLTSLNCGNNCTAMSKNITHLPSINLEMSTMKPILTNHTLK